MTLSIRIVSALSALGIALSATSASAATFTTKAFTDVKAGSTYFEAVEYLRENGVLKGYEDGTFRPNARINRAEFVMLITNPFLLDTQKLGECLQTEVSAESNTIFFSDVARDSWYASAVCLSKTKKLIDGYPDGTFGPNNYINFVEAAKILSNTFVLQTNPEPSAEHWYKKYVMKLDEENAIPMSIDTFGQTITRGEMAEILFRLKTGNKDKQSKTYAQIRAN